jgi:hypothetical protein
MIATKATDDRSSGFISILRDVVLVVALIVMGGPPQSSGLTAGSLLLGGVGFLISGRMSTRNRWRHLTYVTLGVWLTGLIKVLFMRVGFSQWLLHIFPLLVMVACGGALSYVFPKSTPSQRGDRFRS